MRIDIEIGIIITLLNKGKTTYRELASKFDVSTRTICRYFSIYCCSTIKQKRVFYLLFRRKNTCKPSDTKGLQVLLQRVKSPLQTQDILWLIIVPNTRCCDKVSLIPSPVVALIACGWRFPPPQGR